MNTVITIDKAGRVVIPKALRDEWGLGPGDSLQLEQQGEKMTLQPVRASGRLRKKNKFWVFSGGEKLTADIANKVRRDIYEERDRKNRGE